jgi:hypothetical protein
VRNAQAGRSRYGRIPGVKFFVAVSLDLGDVEDLVLDIGSDTENSG